MATPETEVVSAPPRSGSSPGSTPTTRRSSLPRSEAGYATRPPRASPARSSSRSPSTRTSPSGCATSASRLRHFIQRPTPQWGGNPAQIDWDDIHYFVRASEKNSRDWSRSPRTSRTPSTASASPEAERKFLSGVGAQYESEVVYHQVNEKLEEQGVIFTDMDTALASTRTWCASTGRP